MSAWSLKLGALGRAAALLCFCIAGLATMQSCTAELKSGDLSPTPLVAVALRPAQATVSTGATAQFEVYFFYQNGDSLAVSGNQVDWDATGGSITSSGLYTAGGTGGSFQVIAADESGTLADTSVVTVTSGPPTLVAVVLTPSVVTLLPAATRQFSAVGRLSDNSTTAITVSYSATGGSITGGGLYTAGAAAGTFRVIATQQGGTLADTSTVNISASAPTLVRIVLTPVTVTLPPAATQQFTALGRMSDSSNTAVSVNFAATGGTITSGGLYTAGASTGSFLVVATLQGGTLADTSAVTIGTPPPPPPGGTADPTLLPVANGTAQGAMPAVSPGQAYLDDFSGVRVWRLTDATTPQNNSDAHHDYSNGPVQVSRGWGTNGNTHTLLVSAGGYWLVDLTRGVGLSNWRRPPVSPQADICWTFANDPANPQLAYVISGGTLYRVNTSKNAREDAPGFPKTGMGSGACWLMNSADDDWFSTNSGGTTRAYQVSSGLQISTTGPGESYLDKNGRLIVQASEGGSTSQIWDPVTDTKRPVTLPNSHYVHGTVLRGITVTHDVDRGQGTTPVYTTDIVNATASQTFLWPAYSPDYHLAGQWLQNDVGAAQWVLRSPEGRPFGGIAGPCNRAICIFRANGGDGIRQLAYHYSSDAATYWHTAKGTWSPDGKIVMFTSDRGGGRGDVFAAEVPLR